MKKMICGFIVTILFTLLFSITGKSLITMYFILLAEAYFIIKEFKDKKHENIEKENNYIKKQYTVKIKPQPVLKSNTKCKNKVKIKTLEHKR